MDYPDEPGVITRVLKSGRGKQSWQNQRASKSEKAPFLCFCLWRWRKRLGARERARYCSAREQILPESLQKGRVLLTLLILAQQDLYQTSDLQNCKIIHLWFEANEREFVKEEIKGIQVSILWPFVYLGKWLVSSINLGEVGSSWSSS